MAALRGREKGNSLESPQRAVESPSSLGRGLYHSTARWALIALLLRRLHHAAGGACFSSVYAFAKLNCPFNCSAPDSMAFGNNLGSFAFVKSAILTLFTFFLDMLVICSLYHLFCVMFLVIQKCPLFIGQIAPSQLIFASHRGTKSCTNRNQ